MTRIAIIGGGIGGLATAFRLVERGARASDITVLEASPRWGGLLQTSRADGFLFEHGPDSLIRSKPAGLALLRDLGLAGEEQETEPGARRALIARGRRLLPAPAGLNLFVPGQLLPFLGSPLLSWRGKLRALADLWLPRRASGAPEESLAAFVRRRFGDELLERIAQPMAGGISIADPELLSLAAAMPQFLEWEREHRSLILAARRRARADGASAGPRYGLFVTLRGGLHRLVEALIARLSDCDLRLGSAARTATRAGNAWRIATADGAVVAADALVVALPAGAGARLLREAAPALADELDGIPYAGAAILNLAWAAGSVPALPPGAGFVVPAIEHRDVLATTFMSSKYGGRAPAGATLLRVFLGGALREDLLACDDAELTRRALVDLGDLLGFTSAPAQVRIDRWPRSMPQYLVGHQARVARIRALESAEPGLALVGNAYEGVGIPDVAANARSVAERLTERFAGD